MREPCNSTAAGNPRCKTLSKVESPVRSPGERSNVSNCVNIYNGIISLKRHEFDIDRFKALIDSVKGTPRPGIGKILTPEESEKWHAWHFLTNTVFVDQYNVVIGLGEGQDMHTWRDLRATLALLARYARTSKIINLRASDESDGHASRFWLRWDLKRGLPEPEPDLKFQDRLKRATWEHKGNVSICHLPKD